MRPGCGPVTASARLWTARCREAPARNARAQPAAPPDNCYIYNFHQSESPRLLVLPAGEGQRLRDALEDFVDELALAQGVGLIQTAQGLTFAPFKNGEPMASQEYDALPPQERERIAHALSQLKEELLAGMQELSLLRRETQARMRKANADTLALAAGHLVEEIKQRFSAYPQVQSHLDDMLADIVKRGEKFHTEVHGQEEEDDDSDNEEDDGEDGGQELAKVTGSLLMMRYQVNLLAGHHPDDHAPVESCDNPTHAQLGGRIEHVSHRGTLMTNFTMIRAGALHRTHGGYLLIDAVRLLEPPQAWDTLKRALRSNQVVIESLPDAMGLDGGLQSMAPQPAPLCVKVVLFGERTHYERLQAEVLEGRLQIATAGANVGQVNGLAVADLCDLRFGLPLRITATARVGEDKVLDIERESAPGQPLHSKGILTSYLGVARQSFGTGQTPRLRKARQASSGVIRIGIPRGRSG